MLPKKNDLSIVTVITLVLLQGCVSPKVNLTSFASDFSLEMQTQSSGKYEHVLIHNQRRSQVLHIYIEGDGIPWASRYQISADPTPRNPLALKLLTRDTNFALYVSRPCYFGFYASMNCSVTQWTNGRYGKDVVDSIEVVIRKFLESQKISQVIFIGYSGGGVIATLLAARMAETQRLITVAANLDVDKWSKHHGYSPLDQSLNPAEVILSFPRTGYHLSGAKDKVVPYELNQEFIKNMGGQLILFPDYDHSCCWVDNWQNILKNVLNDSSGP